MGRTKLFRKETRCKFYARNRQHANIFDFRGLFLSRLWRAKRDVGFLVGFVVRNGFDAVWFGVFLSRLRRMERAQRDVGFVIRCGWAWVVLGFFFGWVWGGFLGVCGA